MDLELADDLFSADIVDFFSEETVRADEKQKIEARVLARKGKIFVRRAKSEAELNLLIPRLEMGNSYHVISGGDIDSISFAKIVVDKFPLEYLLFSTWCMAVPDVEQIEKWLEEKRVLRVDAYVGEIFPAQYFDAYTKLCEVIKKYGGRVAVFRNHSKIFAGTSPDFSFAIESSANVNTNPRTEQSAIHCDADLFVHYKTFFDGIKSFNRDFDAIEAWSAKSCPAI